MTSSKYSIVTSRTNFQRLVKYQGELHKNLEKAGANLKDIVRNEDLSKLSYADFLQCLLKTKVPRIFAESEIRGDGSDWNKSELEILGAVNVFVKVTVYDNGAHSNPKVHQTPFSASLLYTPGCLLNGRNHFISPDYQEVVNNGSIDEAKYNNLVFDRLFPLFLYVDVASTKKKAIINIPGVGCGAFAGKFQGTMARHFHKAIRNILSHVTFSNIKLVRFDPYNECLDLQNHSETIRKTMYRVRPLVKNPGKTQLCHPREYQEGIEDFSDFELFKIVAWDHVSLPGNDFWAGSRATDDGVAAAATDSMNAFASEDGFYDKERKMFTRKNGSVRWEEVAIHLQVDAQRNFFVVDEDGHMGLINHN